MIFEDCGGVISWIFLGVGYTRCLRPGASAHIASLSFALKQRAYPTPRKIQEINYFNRALLRTNCSFEWAILRIAPAGCFFCSVGKCPYGIKGCEGNGWQRIRGRCLCGLTRLESLVRKNFMCIRAVMVFLLPEF